MHRRLWLSAAAVAVAAVLVAAVPLLVVVAVRDPGLLALGLPLLAVAVAGAVVLARAVAQRAARPVEELAEAAGRLGTGDPRPVGRRYGVTELDQVADGLDSVSRRVTNLLTADRELAIDASHQLRTPLTALSMRLEEMIASADDPDAVREEGTAALAQAERLADVVTQLLEPGPPGGRRVGRADQRRQDRAAADHGVGARLPAGRAEDGADRGVPAAGPRHPGRARPGDRHAARQRADARQGHGDDPPDAVGQLGGDRGRGRGRRGARPSWSPGSSSGASAAGRKAPGSASRWRGRWRPPTAAGSCSPAASRRCSRCSCRATRRPGRPRRAAAGLLRLSAVGGQTGAGHAGAWT